jgi:hypothetical protein
MRKLFLAFLLLSTNALALDLTPTKATLFVASYYQNYNGKLENFTPGLGLSWGADHGVIVGFYKNAYKTHTYYAGYAKSWQPAPYLVTGISAGIYKNESREGLHGFLVPYVGVPIGRVVPKLSYAKKTCMRCTGALTLSVDYIF